MCNVMYQLGYESRAARMLTCGGWLIFGECPGDEHDYKKLKKANFCRDRMCPMCNWRRSLKMQGQISKVLHKATEVQDLRFILLSLTIRNMDASALQNACKGFMRDFNLLMKKKAVNKICVGFVRNLEITYKADANTYHPHVHVLMAVEPSYFNKYYISQAKWTDYWQEVCNLDYKPIVHVKSIKVLDDGGLGKAAAEVGKYTVKDSDYALDSERASEIVRCLTESLKGLRLLGFGKLFRQLHKALNLDDIESDTADLVGKSGGCNCRICGSTLFEQLYQWNYGHNVYTLTLRD